jgi:predicted transcriptional regulator
MQLNLYVPKEREAVVRQLDEAAQRSGRPKNVLVLEALEHYLAQQPAERPKVKLRTWHLGVMEPWSREDAYREREDRILNAGRLQVAEEKAPYEAGD